MKGFPPKGTGSPPLHIARFCSVCGVTWTEPPAVRVCAQCGGSPMTSTQAHQGHTQAQYDARGKRGAAVRSAQW